MRPLNLREYGEALRAAGDEWGDAIIEAADAQEQIESRTDPFNEVLGAMEDHGVYYDEEAPHIAVKRLAAQDEALHGWLEHQDDNWWHVEGQDLPQRIANGVASLEKIRDEYEAIVAHLEQVGAIDETSDVLATIKLLIG